MGGQLRAFRAPGILVTTQRNAGIFKQIFARLLLAEAVAGNGLDVLRAEHHDGLRHQAQAVAPDRGQRKGDGLQHHLAGGRGMLAHAARRLGGEQR